MGQSKRGWCRSKEDGAAAGNKSVSDESAGQWSGQWIMEHGRTQQPTMDGSKKGKQWQAKMKVRGQRLAMAVKVGGGGLRRDYCGQRGVIAASEATEASWIWTTKMHATEGGGKQENGSVFW